jgi:hypothetical protein
MLRGCVRAEALADKLVYMAEGEVSSAVTV